MKHSIVFNQGNESVELNLAPEKVEWIYQLLSKFTNQFLSKGDIMELLEMNTNVDSATDYEWNNRIKEVYPNYNPRNMVNDYRLDKDDKRPGLTNIYEKLGEKLADLLENESNVGYTNRISAFKQTLKDLGKIVPMHIRVSILEFAEVDDWKSISEIVHWENAKDTNNGSYQKALKILIHALPYFNK